jgi:hypothetical protein
MRCSCCSNWKLPDKLAAIHLENELARDGDPNNANDEIAALFVRCMR